MIGLIERGERAAATRARKVAETVAARVGEVPGVTAQAEGTDVVLSGRALVRRTISDARLMWIAGWMR